MHIELENAASDHKISDIYWQILGIWGFINIATVSKLDVKLSTAVKSNLSEDFGC